MPYIAETLRLRPNLAEAHINFGAALSKRGDFDAAVAQYRKALHLDPDNPDAQEGLGVILTEKGQLKRRSRISTRPRRHARRREQALQSRPPYGLAGHPDLAAASSPRPCDCSRKMPRPISTWALPLPRRIDSAEAADQFREALRLKPDYVAARFNLASALANLELGRGHRRVSRGSAHAAGFPGAAQALEACLEMKKNTAH